jgi:prephenate dehydrogenase
MAEIFKQMTVCGVGLIGGSLALAARRAGAVGRIVGLGRTQANLDVAGERGMLDVATRDAAEAARGAELVVLAVPILTMRAVLSDLLPYLPASAIVTDVGSVKGWVVKELEPLLGERMALVAAHPIAGKETTGAASADADLFRNRRVIVTPSTRSSAEALERVEALWHASGARVERMSPDEHDEILARASHLPQVVASALAAALDEERIGGKLAAEFGATGLRDTTRLASSSWEVWRDIFATNREAISAALRLYGRTFREFARLIDAGDMAGLEALFNRGRGLRRRLK